jgi:hypothetical protein
LTAGEQALIEQPPLACDLKRDAAGAFVFLSRRFSRGRASMKSSSDGKSYQANVLTIEGADFSVPSSAHLPVKYFSDFYISYRRRI